MITLYSDKMYDETSRKTEDPKPDFPSSDRRNHPQWGQKWLKRSVRDHSKFHEMVPSVDPRLTER